MSSNNTGSTNEAVKTAHGVSTANFKDNASNLPNVDSLSDAVIYSFFAMADGNADNESKEISQEDWKKSRAPKNQDIKNRETTKRTVPDEEGPTNFALMAYTSSGSSSSSSSDNKFRDNALTELRKKFEKAEKERDDLKLTLEKFKNSSKNLSKLIEIQVSDKFKTGVGFDSQVFDIQVNDKYKTGEGYHAVPPPYTGNFMPPKFNLVFADEEEYVFSESITSVPAVATCKVKISESKPKSVSEPLIEDWISDSESEYETESKSKPRKPSFAKVEYVKSNEHVKSPRKSVKKVENNKQAEYPRKISQSPRGNKRN
ncbi:hypothetical protein Tco_0494190 [Tanacetum coccineum]